MFDLGKILPAHVLEQLPLKERRTIARTYIYGLIIAGMIGAFFMASGYLGKRWLLPTMDWNVFEFGRYTYGTSEERCRLGEIVLTSIPSKRESLGSDVKWVAGYANSNEKYWVESRTDQNEITLLGESGLVQIFKARPENPNLFLLEQWVHPDGREEPGNNAHYLRRMFEPGVFKGSIHNTEYLVHNTCPGFQSRD